jgi:DNA adenine methylase
LNHELIDTLVQIQINADNVAECLARMSVNRRDYYATRALRPNELTPNERAARFIYLNTLCFNGLYRVNGQGKFNVPYGSKLRKMPFDPFQLRQASRVLAHADIEPSDFESMVNKTGKGDFIYLDPPYVTTSQRVFAEYGKKVFTHNDLSRLILALEGAAKRGARYVLSYADVPEACSLRKLGKICRVQVRRNIAGFADSRRYVHEILVTNCE